MSLEIKQAAVGPRAIDWKLFLVVNGESLSYMVWRDNRLGVSKHKTWVDGVEDPTIFRRDGFDGKYSSEGQLLQAVKN